MSKAIFTREEATIDDLPSNAKPKTAETYCLGYEVIPIMLQ